MEKGQAALPSHCPMPYPKRTHANRSHLFQKMHSAIYKIHHISTSLLYYHSAARDRSVNTGWRHPSQSPDSHRHTPFRIRRLGGCRLYQHRVAPSISIIQQHRHIPFRIRVLQGQECQQRGPPPVSVIKQHGHIMFWI